jgi:hypothetical protein
MFIEKDWSFWCDHDWLHHDCVSTNSSLKTTEFIINKNMVVVPHPSYLLGLAPNSFALFPKLKIKIKEQCSETVSDIQWDLQVVPSSFKENYFPGIFEACRKWLRKLSEVWEFSDRLVCLIICYKKWY